jgi:subtilase family serine protease
MEGISIMRMQSGPVSKLFAAPILLLVSAVCASAQVNSTVPRITQPVDDSRLTVLHGNTHPLARPEFDRGAAPSDLAMDRMLLVLKRGPQQEAALEKLMAQQQDKSSPNFHKWLTPAQFGAQFGPADQDVETITRWLESHGFQVAPVSNGRTVIEFSGNAGQVQQAFHTAIHKFVVDGEQHWANVKDPAIPAALTPAVAGVVSLHNFFPKPMSRVTNAASHGHAIGNSSSARSQVTFTSNACGLTAVVDCLGLGPTDFATIYNVLPLWNAGIDGTGETIAIANDSNINTQDVTDFRSLFGLPAKLPTVTVNGTDPGKTADEVEAILDVEWSGAIAKNANIDLVVSPSSQNAGTFGGDLSDTFIVNEASTPSVLSESFGACELFVGTTENTFYNTTWQQGATEGITVLVSSGDDGSAACDFDNPDGPAEQPAEGGLAVNGIASTPFNVAVGGTEFNDLSNPLQFYSSNTTPGTQVSALGYIPEMTYNDSCTANAVINFFGDGNAVTACNDPTVQEDEFVVTAGGSGGPSTCISSDGIDPSSCTGGYPKPCWQGGAITATCTQHSGINTPNDGVRDLPDIALFAGDGTISGSFYIICERDFPGINPNIACSLNDNFISAGGTSVSTQVFAGIMALVDQKNEDKQGLANPTLYSLAAAGGNTCTSAANPAGTCVFYDVTTDTIAMPCLQGTTDCLVNTAVGVLPGYNAGTGYDLATGLGSVNAANLVNASGAWVNTTSGNDFTVSANSPTATVPSQGSVGQVVLNVTADGAFNGVVTFACFGLPSETTCSGQSVTGNGQSTILFQTTAPSMLAPINTPDHVGWPGIGTMIALVFAFCISLLLLGASIRNRRWTVALALAAFALVFVSAGCGGGGSGGGGGGGGGGVGGTPLGTTEVVITATSGSIQRSVSVALTVN